MSSIKEQTIITLKSKDAPKDNSIQIGAVATLMSNSENLTVKNAGVALLPFSGTINSSVVNNKKAHDDAETATTTMHQANDNGVVKYNEAAKIVMLAFPNNPDMWAALGFDVSSGTAHSQTAPDKVLNGSITQGDYAAQCDLHFDPAARAANYTVQYITGDPAIIANYKMVTNPKMIFTSSKISFILPPDALNKDLWVIVTAHNTAGDSPASEPFGGRKIQ